MLVLERDTYSKQVGVFGTLWFGDLSWQTVERPWIDNQPSVSCIPDGLYKVGLRHYNRGGYDTLEIENVPGRSHILIHKGNTPDQVQGCIAIGKGRGVLSSKLAVLSSGIAFDEFWAAVHEAPPHLISIRCTVGAVI